MSLIFIFLSILAALLILNVLLLKFSCNKIPKEKPTHEKQFSVGDK